MNPKSAGLASTETDADDVELEIPARAEFVSIARIVVGSLATDMGFSEDRVDDLRLAVSEACTNAIEAHGAIDTDERVRLQCHADDTGLEVCIADSGPGFDPDELGHHPPVTDPDRLHFERGLGIPLIRTLVDVAEFTSSGSGTQVRMVLLNEPYEPYEPSESAGRPPG